MSHLGGEKVRAVRMITIKDECYGMSVSLDNSFVLFVLSLS
jgi:hypothetical protein